METERQNPTHSVQKTAKQIPKRRITLSFGKITSCSEHSHNNISTPKVEKITEQTIREIKKHTDIPSTKRIQITHHRQRNMQKKKEKKYTKQNQAIISYIRVLTDKKKQESPKGTT